MVVFSGQGGAVPAIELLLEAPSIIMFIAGNAGRVKYEIE